MPRPTNPATTAAARAPGRRGRTLVLAAMIVAVSMSFIDQTIVSIAMPQIQGELGLSSTAMQWAINAYIVSLAALFAFGGRLADIAGHRRMVTLGVAVFGTASLLCGLTPTGSLAEPWLVTWRIVQGAGGAIMFPAALAIVVQTFPLRERGRALAAFFGIAGGLTAIGPLLGGYLVEWTWRGIFWVNVPVAILALVLIAIARPQTEHASARMDYRGLALIAPGVGLSVLGLQQASSWGWTSPATLGCIAAGAVLLVAFAIVESRTRSPLIDVRLFRVRAFLVENVVLAVSALVFIPVFVFGSAYAQISLGMSAMGAATLLLWFFIGFAAAAQIGGRMLDRAGAKLPVTLGCAISAVGFLLWAGAATDLRFDAQRWYIVLAGAGIGMMMGPASTDAVNRASRLSYGEATGITQTVRNFAAALGLAIIGTILINQTRDHVTTSLTAQGLSAADAREQASQIAQFQGGHSATGAIPDFLRHDVASATSTVLYVMAALMAVGALIALIGLRSGAQEEVVAVELDETLVAQSA